MNKITKIIQKATKAFDYVRRKDFKGLYKRIAPQHIYIQFSDLCTMTSKQSLLIDSFTFFNEYEILDFRLRLLYPYIDKFVIVESDHTFSGKPKPYNFLANRDRYAWAMDKIVYYQHKAHDV